MSRPSAASDPFRAIADPTRRAVLDLLAEGELPVGDLATSFKMTQPAVSQHLRVLRQAGLVTDRRVGRARVYRIRPAQLRAVAAWLGPYQRFWQGKLGALGAYLERTR